MEPWLLPIITAIGAILAGPGFWVWVTKRDSKKTARDRLLMGIAYDKIVYLGMSYIERGWISKDEFEDYRTLYYEPYKDLGGNGVGDRIYQDVTALKIRNAPRYKSIEGRNDE